MIVLSQKYHGGVGSREGSIAQVPHLMSTFDSKNDLQWHSRMQRSFIGNLKWNIISSARASIVNYSVKRMERDHHYYNDCISMIEDRVKH